MTTPDRSAGAACPAGLIFDMDGVLMLSGPAHAQSWRDAMEQQGLTWSADAFEATFGMTSRGIIRHFWGEGLDDAAVERIDEEKEAAYRDLVRGRLPVSPGAHAMLGRCGAAVEKMAVATSGPTANLDLVPVHRHSQSFGGELGWGRHFAALVSGDDVVHGKPAPDCFRLAAERLGLAPAECVAVKDAPVGVMAARAARIAVIGVTSGHTNAELCAVGAAFTIETVGELAPHHLCDAVR